MDVLSDAQPTQPLPDPAAQWVLSAPAAPARRRRRAWPWIVAILIVLALAAAAWFAGEWIARDLVSKTIRQQVISSLALPADQAVDVTISGAVLPQLIGGGLDDVTVASDDVTLGTLTGDVSVHAEGIRLGGTTPTAAAATATVSLDGAQLQALLASVPAIPADTVRLAAPDITMSTSISVLGISIPIGVTLAPSAADGDLVLTPASLQVAGNAMSADDLRNRFGAVADGILGGYEVCIAQYLPAGLALTDISVQSERLVADFTIDPAIVSDAALQAKGTCA